MKTFKEEYLNKPVIMGVRPKAISIKGDLAYVEQGFTAKVNISEKLGDNTILYTNIDGIEGEIISSVEGIKTFNEGDKVDISFDLKNVCFFDKESEESLL